MRVASLSLRAFRNLEPVRMEPSPGLTVIVGDNGQGKTNLMEAVFLLATGKSLRASKLGEMVSWGSDSCEVSGVVSETIDRDVRIVVKDGRRRITVDSKPPTNLESFSDILKVVCFTPDDLQIVKGPAAGRRRWLDRAVFTRHAQYATEHKRFDRSLRSRNRLLREWRDGRRSKGEMEAFEAAVASSGARLWRRRTALIGELASLIAQRFETIARMGEPLEVAYEMRNTELKASGLELSEERLESYLREILVDRRSSDLRRGFTTVGPQADDVVIKVGGRDVRAFASQGQQRAAVLSLKIAEIENLRERLNRTPVLLLDDVSSELDPARNEHLLTYLESFPGQALATTTDPELAPRGENETSLRLEVSGGRIFGPGMSAVEIGKARPWYTNSGDRVGS